MNVTESTVCCHHIPCLKAGGGTLGSPFAAQPPAGPSSKAGQATAGLINHPNLASVVSLGRWVRDQRYACTDIYLIPTLYSEQWLLKMACICMERDSRAGAREAAGMNPSSVHEREKLGLENGESGQIICWGETDWRSKRLILICVFPAVYQCVK